MKLSRFVPLKPIQDEWISGSHHSFHAGARGVNTIEVVKGIGVIVTLDQNVPQRDGTVSPGRFVFWGDGSYGRIDDSKGEPTKAADSANWMTGSDVA
jgi:hypothetical protein